MVKNYLFLFFDENGQWRKTVSRFWRKIAMAESLTYCHNVVVLVLINDVGMGP